MQVDHLLVARAIQGFPWVPHVWRRNIVPCLKSGTCLVGTLGELGFKTQLFPLKRVCQSIPRLLCGWPLAQVGCRVFHLCNIVWSFLLTSSYSVLVFFWLCPICPQQILYIKALYFSINLLAQIVQNSWFQLPRLLYYLWSPGSPHLGTGTVRHCRDAASFREVKLGIGCEGELGWESQ